MIWPFDKWIKEQEVGMKQIRQEHKKFDWDQKNIHFCLAAGQCAQEAKQACGIWLSTWVAAGNHGTTTETRVGYSFDTLPVSCPACIAWMEKNLNRCKTCNAICRWSMCSKCADIWIDMNCDVCGLRYGSGKCFHPTSQTNYDKLKELIANGKER